MNILICISSKSPNPYLHQCISALYENQIKHIDNYKICVVDSDSDDLTNYYKINENYPNVEICFIKNKHYEYGAYKYAIEKYPDYDIYFCIQDSNIINKYIDLNILNDNVAYIYNNPTGYYSHLSIKELGCQLLKDSGLNYYSIINEEFSIVTHNIFIVNNKIMKDIFTTLTIPPINKDGSCAYERNFGIYFILKNIQTINIKNFIRKTHGNRN